MINNYIIYKREVCIIKEVLEKYMLDKDYYVLTLLNDDSLKIKVPINSKDLRSLITKDKVDQIIENIPNIEAVNTDSKNLETVYKELLLSNKHEDLVRIIKTSYLRNKEREEKKKKLTDKDIYYFNLAERYLYQEFQVVLGLSYDKTKEYVIKNLSS